MNEWEAYWEVTTIADGALEDYDSYPDYGAALSAARVASEELERASVPDSAVYLLPHYCSPEQECVCRQYDTDHTPYWESTDPQGL